MPLGAEPGTRHALQLDAESVSRLHARLPLLLRAPVSDAVRARPRRSVLIGDLRQDQPRRGAEAGARQTLLDAELVAVGTATDPYQPIEGHYKLTRRALEALLAGRTPIGLVTKGPMVVRDADLLAELGKRVGCSVCVSVPDRGRRGLGGARAWNRSPAPAAASRTNAARGRRERRRADGADRPRLHDAAAPARSHDQGGRRSRRRVHGHERPPPQRRARRITSWGFSRKSFPRWLTRYRRLYPGVYAPPSYVNAVRDVVKALKERHHVHSRTLPVPSEPESDDARPDSSEEDLEQTAFKF